MTQWQHIRCILSTKTMAMLVAVFHILKAITLLGHARQSHHVKAPEPTPHNHFASSNSRSRCNQFPHISILTTRLVMLQIQMQFTHKDLVPTLHELRGLTLQNQIGNLELDPLLVLSMCR
jgi:hypothetical protein